MHIPNHPNKTLGRLEQALRLSVQAEPVVQVIKAGHLAKSKPIQMINAAIKTVRLVRSMLL